VIDLATARETFESSTDGTVGIEEEFALIDPATHLLVPRFETLRDAARPDPVLAESIAGELISSEIEIRSGRGEDAEDARARQADRRRRLFTLAAANGVALGSTGTHPLSD
jgi:carboxylate-amine ligase